MSIWEFAGYSYEDIEAIYTHCIALETLGIEQNEYMMRELRAERGKRQEEAY